MAFPDTIDSFTSKVNNVDVVDASHINTLQNTIVTIENVLFQLQRNFLYHSLSHNLWQEGTTFNDIADDTYVADVWNVIHSGNAPDITQQIGTYPQPAYYFRCTFDSTAQCGILQFLENRDTLQLRGKRVTLSFDAWGSGVSNLRAALLSWTGTADAITSDVVSTWSVGNPTLAANWANVNTPSSIAISTGVDRYAVEDITVPSNANNLAAFIWTPDSEVNTDLFNVGNVRLAPALIDGPFVARSFAEELALGQRFLQTFDYAGYGGTWLSASEALMYMSLPVQMRVAPTLTLLDTSPVFIEITSGGGVLNTRTGSSSTITGSGASTKAFFVQVDGFSSATAGSFASISGAQIGTDWIKASARL